VRCSTHSANWYLETQVARQQKHLWTRLLHAGTACLGHHTDCQPAYNWSCD
jgi:hypothetical protein